MFSVQYSDDSQAVVKLPFLTRNVSGKTERAALSRMQLHQLNMAVGSEQRSVQRSGDNTHTHARRNKQNELETSSGN